MRRRFKIRWLRSKFSNLSRQSGSSQGRGKYRCHRWRLSSSWSETHRWVRSTSRGSEGARLTEQAVTEPTGVTKGKSTPEQ